MVFLRHSICTHHVYIITIIITRTDTKHIIVKHVYEIISPNIINVKFLKYATIKTTVEPNIK